MGTLVDTSVLVEVERGHLDFETAMSGDGDDTMATATICAAELLLGLHRLPNPLARSRAERVIESILKECVILPFDLAMARVHAQLAADLRAKGTPVGAHDLIIAATAIALDYRVATRDLRSFPKIQGLNVVRW